MGREGPAGTDTPSTMPARSRCFAIWRWRAPMPACGISLTDGVSGVKMTGPFTHHHRRFSKEIPEPVHSRRCYRSERDLGFAGASDPCASGRQLSTGPLGERIESAPVQQLVKTLIKRLPDGCRQPGCLDPDGLLLFVRSSLAQRHESILRRFSCLRQAKTSVAP